MSPDQRDHDQRNSNGGSPFSVQVSAKVTERFWSRVNVRGPDECWLWTGAVLGYGHGQLHIRGKIWLAHRLAYALVHGTDSIVGRVVRHACDVPRCCNVAHLAVGTAQDNVRDRVERNRSASKLTPEQVREIAGCGGRQADVAARFGVSQATVSVIRSGGNWSHVTGIARTG
jgi:hypothetical protein